MFSTVSSGVPYTVIVVGGGDAGTEVAEVATVAARMGASTLLVTHKYYCAQLVRVPGMMFEHDMSVSFCEPYSLAR